jgi:hypothetical protein
MFGSCINVFLVPELEVDYVVVSDLLDERVLVGRTFVEKIFRQPVNTHLNVRY